MCPNLRYNLGVYLEGLRKMTTGAQSGQPICVSSCRHGTSRTRSWTANRSTATSGGNWKVKGESKQRDSEQRESKR
jgi:hypothetical protein